MVAPNIAHTPHSPATMEAVVATRSLSMPAAWRLVGTLIVDEAPGVRSEVLEELRS